VYATTENDFLIGGVLVKQGQDRSRKLDVTLYKYDNLHALNGDFEGYRVLLESGEEVSIGLDHQSGGGFGLEIPELRVLRLTIGRTLIQ